LLGWNHTKAGVSAVVVAHGVLFAYIWVALKEEQDDQREKKDK
jgi:hypothetical protein